ncbi:hypothetical protein PCE1_003802 [Barthelona sp. PCE]
MVTVVEDTDSVDNLGVRVVGSYGPIVQLSLLKRSCGSFSVFSAYVNGEFAVKNYEWRGDSLVEVHESQYFGALALYDGFYYNCRSYIRNIKDYSGTVVFAIEQFTKKDTLYDANIFFPKGNAHCHNIYFVNENEEVNMYHEMDESQYEMYYTCVFLTSDELLHAFEVINDCRGDILVTTSGLVLCTHEDRTVKTEAIMNLEEMEGVDFFEFNSCYRAEDGALWFCDSQRQFTRFCTVTRQFSRHECGSVSGYMFWDTLTCTPMYYDDEKSTVERLEFHNVKDL